MSDFKSLKEEMLGYMFKENGFISVLKNDGSRYGSMDPDDLVHNELIGICRVKEIMELENERAIVFEGGRWKVKTYLMQVDASNKERFHKDRFIGEWLNIPVAAWYDWQQKKKDETYKLQINAI